MATYEVWNAAVIAYVTAGAARGSTVFLSIDDDAIREIASRFIDEPVAGDPIGDFIAAVRSRIVWQQVGVSLTLRSLEELTDRQPDGAAFLGVMVLAAYRMQEEHGIDESNYFLRLREVLGLPSGHGGRPEGMDAGSEEPLWRAWNEYLVASGFQTSAERGAGPQTYLRYVFSQAILRESDKNYLLTIFDDPQLKGQVDCDQLGFWLSQQRHSRKHLQEGLEHPDPSHVWEFYQAAHRLYEAGKWSANPPETLQGGGVRKMECGLYRDETLTGDVDYLLFPKQLGRFRHGVLTTNNEPQALRRELKLLRPGFFQPLWAQSPFVENAIDFGIDGDAIIRTMLFPKRDFWILTVDPENAMGAWATWKPFIDLGEKFLLLVRPGPFDSELERFREAKLIQWSNRRVADGWVEYEECMVLSYDWGGYISPEECRPLVQALTPKAMARVALSGGLRDPNQNAWLQGNTPVLRVYGFERVFQVTVTGALRAVVFKGDVEHQQDIQLPEDLVPGTYQIEVKYSNRSFASRMFRIVSSTSLQVHRAPPSLDNWGVFSTGGVGLSGPFILPRTAPSAEGVLRG